MAYLLPILSYLICSGQVFFLYSFSITGTYQRKNGRILDRSSKHICMEFIRDERSFPAQPDSLSFHYYFWAINGYYFLILFLLPKNMKERKDQEIFYEKIAVKTKGRPVGKENIKKNSGRPSSPLFFLSARQQERPLKNKARGNQPVPANIKYEKGKATLEQAGDEVTASSFILYFTVWMP